MIFRNSNSNSNIYRIFVALLVMESVMLTVSIVDADTRTDTQIVWNESVIWYTLFGFYTHT